MRSRQLVPPVTLPVSVDEAKAQVRVLADAEDVLIEGYLRSALAYAEKTCGRAFEPQTWQATFDAFPVNGMMTPLVLHPGPLVSVTSIFYLDVDSAEQEVLAADFVVDAAHGQIVAAVAWPATSVVSNAVRVVYVAGEGTPEDVRQAILLLAGHWFNMREAAGPAMQPIPYGVETILSLHRHIWV